MKTLVVKIGGSYWGSVSNGAEEKCRELAEKLVELSREYGLVVVPSAFGGRTDQLVEEAESVYGKPLKKCPEVDEIVSRGEVEASEQLYINLMLNGQKARLVYPNSKNFPIVTDENGKVDLQRSYEKLNELSRRCREKGKILIVPGFVAKNCSGVVTLGRNGSDYSAVIVGEGVNADEIVKLGAAPGVSDGNSGYLNEVSAADLLAKIDGNGNGYEKIDCIFHPKGLKILSPGRVINVTNNIDSYFTGNIQYGTVIVG